MSSSGAARLEAVRLRRAAWRKAHPEEDRRLKREYYAKNKEKCATASRKWQITHAGDVQARYRELRNKARRKKLSCLSFEEFAALPAVCHYCGFPRPLKGCGLDRRDNSGGYDLANVLPACTTCNMVRGTRFTVAEMEKEVGPTVRRIRLGRGEVSP